MSGPQIVGGLLLGIPLIWWLLWTDTGNDVLGFILAMAAFVLVVFVVVVLLGMLTEGTWPWEWSS